MDALEQKLPTYMIPRVVIPLDSFPLNKNKKVDTGRLMELGSEFLRQANETAEETDDNCSPLEQTVRHVWMEVLCISELSIS